MRRTSPARTSSAKTSSVRRSWGPASSERALRPFEVFCPVSRNKTYRRGCRAPPVFRNPLLKEGPKKGPNFRRGCPPRCPSETLLPGGCLRAPARAGAAGAPAPGGGERRPRPPAVKARPRSFDQGGGGRRSKLSPPEPKSRQSRGHLNTFSRLHVRRRTERGIARGSGGLPAPRAPSSALQPRVWRTYRSSNRVNRGWGDLRDDLRDVRHAGRDSGVAMPRAPPARDSPEREP